MPELIELNWRKPCPRKYVTSTPGGGFSATIEREYNGYYFVLVTENGRRLLAQDYRGVTLAELMELCTKTIQEAINAHETKGPD